MTKTAGDCCEPTTKTPQTAGELKGTTYALVMLSRSLATRSLPRLATHRSRRLERLPISALDTLLRTTRLRSVLPLS